MSAECFNEEWCESEIGPDYTPADLHWARGMWSCDCPPCLSWPSEVTA